MLGEDASTINLVIASAAWGAGVELTEDDLTVRCLSWSGDHERTRHAGLKIATRPTNYKKMVHLRWQFAIGLRELETWRSNSVLGEDAGTINLLIASEERQSALACVSLRPDGQMPFMVRRP